MGLTVAFQSPIISLMINSASVTAVAAKIAVFAFGKR
jgi:hypothetical protein